MRARDLVAAALTEGLSATGATDVEVRPYTRTIDALTVPTVLLHVSTVTPSAFRMAWKEWTLTAFCAVPQTDPSADVEDALDDLLGDVLAALDAGDAGILWTTATRATLEGLWPCYQITLTATTKEPS